MIEQIRPAFEYGPEASAPLTGTVSGTLKIKFTDRGMALVQSGGHHNTSSESDPAIGYGGHEYLFGFHFERNADGTWVEHAYESGWVEEPRVRGSFTAKATPKARAAIVSAICAALPGVWSPDIDKQARHAYLSRELHSAHEERAKLWTALAQHDEQYVPLWMEYRGASDAERFFFEHAGYSYGPDETPAHGRQRTARELANAEAMLKSGPYLVEIEPDWEPYDGTEPYDGPVWVVTLYREDDTETPEMLGCIGGVACEDGDPYLRVVAAELADEWIVRAGAK